MSSFRRWARTAAIGLWAVAAITLPATAQTADLTKLSLEDLLNTEITSVSRKEQTLSRTAAAVYVITDEDIRRSGAKTIPDLLRMVPGFNVAQIDATNWAVTSRGFNGVYSNKLLVLIDGRSVYGLLFAGVYWEMQNLRLDDIQRIEVVRGPGGSLWGTNAVNGIVNIITKPADDTQGGLAKIAGGGVQRGAGELRYGGRLGDSTYYRLYGKYSARGTGNSIERFENPDDGSVRLGGVRLDWRGEVDRVSVHGSVQDGEAGEVRAITLLSAPWAAVVKQDSAFTDGHALVSWTRSASSRVETGVQASYQNYVRHQDFREVDSFFSEHWRIFDVEARQRRALGARHELVAGAGYRLWSAAIVNTPHVAFTPAHERSFLVTGFLQDEIELRRNLWFTPGVKLEHNEFTGLEVQPSARATWSPVRGNAFWAAVSRSVRTPVKKDLGLRVPVAALPGTGGMPMLITIEGDPANDSETLQAFEAGYRVQLGRASLDVTTFRNEYGNLIGSQARAPAPGTFDDRLFFLLPVRLTDGLSAHTYGAEAAATWQPIDRWRMSLSSSLLKTAVHTTGGDIVLDDTANAAVPERQLSLRSYIDLPGDVEASLLLHRVGAVPSGPKAYTSANARVAWRPRPVVEVAFGAENLFHNGAREIVESAGLRSVPTRTTVFGEVALRF